jgi:hypothetical protein
MRTPSFFLACALAGAAVTGMVSAAHAASPEAVTIDTNFTVYTPPVRFDPYDRPRPPQDAAASVILMAGGNGLLSLDPTGAIINSTGDLLIRSAYLFLRGGLNVMMADTAPAHPNGIDLTFRLSPTHAAEIQGFINAAINRWGKPVWVVGTSSGGVSAVTAAGINPALSGLAGIALVSTFTIIPGNQTKFDLYLSQITVPVAIYYNELDHCPLSPRDGVLFGLIPKIKNESAFGIPGGHSVATDPCGAFSEHGAAGIETSVIINVIPYIKHFRERPRLVGPCMVQAERPPVCTIP